jgi:hypothetical protein
MSQHKMQELNANKNGDPIVDNKTRPGQYRCGKKIVTVTGTESRVDQAQAINTDLANLLEPAMRKRLLRHSVKFAGQYDDLPYTDYRDAMNKIAIAKSMYEQLPPDLTGRFQDPGEFLKYVQNPANAKEMQDLGILQGNDGLTGTGAPSGAPTKTDMNGDGKPDNLPPVSNPPA